MSSKKTNKTSHVLNILTNHDEVEGAAEGAAEAALPQDEAQVEEIAAEAALPAESAETVPPPEDASQPEEAASPSEEPQPIPEIAAAQEAVPEAALEAADPAPAAQSEPAAEPVQGAESEEIPQPAEAAQSQQPAPAPEVADQIKEKLAEEARAFLAGNFNPSSVADKIMSMQAEVKLKEVDDYEYFYVNILENIVKQRVVEVMQKSSPCSCTRCVNDAIALALNQLPPKYVVTTKGGLFVQAALYEKQYSVDVISAATRACMKIAEHPSHD